MTAFFKSLPIRLLVVGATCSSIALSYCEPKPVSRKIIVFGSSSHGKSSVINAVLDNAQQSTSKRALVGQGVHGCTFESEAYRFSEKQIEFVLQDTVGLDEPDGGKVDHETAKRKLLELLYRMAKGGVSALVMVMKDSAIHQTHLDNYNLFIKQIANAEYQKIPRILVVTHVDGDDNEKKAKIGAYLKAYENHGCKFDFVVVGQFNCSKNLPNQVLTYYQKEISASGKSVIKVLENATVKGNIAIRSYMFGGSVERIVWDIFQQVLPLILPFFGLPPVNAEFLRVCREVMTKVIQEMSKAPPDEDY